MNDLAIKVKDVKEFVKSERALYASCKGKRFFVALHAGPNVNRYIVELDGSPNGFTKLGDAVKFFNSAYM